MNIPYKHPYAKHGIVATLGTGKAPCIALRTDMDALPIPVSLASKTLYGQKLNGHHCQAGSPNMPDMYTGNAKLKLAAFRPLQIHSVCMTLAAPWYV